MMNVLTILAHPRQDGFCWDLYGEVNRFCRSNKLNLKTVDLYREDFDPVLRHPEPPINSRMVACYQELVSWADVVIFVSPVWWYRCSTMLEGFFDKVLSHGFAFGPDGPMLAGKSAMVFLSYGTSRRFNKIVLANSLKVRLTLGVLNRCFGKSTVKNLFGASERSRRAFALEVAMIALRGISVPGSGSRLRGAISKSLNKIFGI